MQDNGFESVDAYPVSGQLFDWDETLAVDELISRSLLLSDKKYATKYMSNGSVYYVVKPGDKNKPINNPIPNPPADMYTLVREFQWTSGADGTTEAIILDESSNPATGWDIVSVIKDIKPMLKADYTWNKNTAKLTLLNGETVDNGEDLSVFVTKLV